MVVFYWRQEMSDQSKYYDYYMVEGEDVKELIQSYDTINDQRNSILTTAAKRLAQSHGLQPVAGVEKADFYKASFGKKDMNSHAR